MLRWTATTLAALALAVPAPAQLMEPATQARLEKALPRLGSKAADDALHGRTPGKRLFYTSTEIEHASQDGTGDRVGFYLAAHNRSANKDGFPGTDFSFPWKNPGGTDGNGVEESVAYAWKVLFLPEGTSIRVHRTPLKSFFAGARGNVFTSNGYRETVNGYGWTFPDGTRFYEMLSFQDRLSVFEVRTRHKDGGKWRVNVYRPFVTREDFAEVVDGYQARVQWWNIDDKYLHRNKSAFSVQVPVEEIPGLASTREVDALLRSRVFESALNRDWSDESGAAPRTSATTAIVPQGYNGAFAGNSLQSCQKCHQDAGTHVRFFDASREWYGFVRGEQRERILSFHPIDPSAISRDGRHRAMVLNKKLLDAGLIEWRP